MKKLITEENVKENVLDILKIEITLALHL